MDTQSAALQGHTPLEAELLEALRSIADAAELEAKDPDSFDESLYDFAARIARAAIAKATNG